MLRLLVSICFLATLSLRVEASPSLEGVFIGSIKFFQSNGISRDIPLQLSLYFSEERETINTGSGPRETRIIDGAFVIDDEGGPYMMTRVFYDIDTNTLDMRYSRDFNGPENRSPASLRLTGRIREDGVIEGRVISGEFGRVGSFQVSPSEQQALVVNPKYYGEWTGIAPSPLKKYSFTIQPALGLSINPLNMELAFTPGKIGSVNLGGGVEVGFNRVSIDYFRRTLRLAAEDVSGPNVVLECSILDDELNLRCRHNTVYGGSGSSMMKRVVLNQK